MGTVQRTNYLIQILLERGIIDSRENLHEKLRYFTLLFVRIKSKGNKDRKRKVVPTFIRGLCLMSRKR
ncbi:MAG: hypothetical protein DRQ04_03395 [Candidatus Hydrothermota bacterium]|nr:MAG: hypothetical protein DRQ04_03395 [Candidatus Hydrothermae bacterium]